MKRVLLVVATVAALVVTAAPAAHADELPTGCNIGGHNLSAWAYYSPGGTYNEWYQFDYLLWGSGTGGKSNVNIWLYEGGAVRWQYRSPDSLHGDVLYSTTPSSPVFLNASAQEYAKFEAIFDVFWSDPRCTTTTARV